MSIVGDENGPLSMPHAGKTYKNATFDSSLRWPSYLEESDEILFVGSGWRAWTVGDSSSGV